MSHLDTNDILAVVSGRLAEALRRFVDEHLDACSECRRVVAILAGAQGEGERDGLAGVETAKPARR